MREKGKEKFIITMWMSKVFKTLLYSVRDKFEMGRPDFIYKGLLYMLARQRDIEDNIALSNYCKASMLKNGTIVIKPHGKSKPTTIYIYDIIYEHNDRISVAYKENNDPSDYEFKALRKKPQCIEEEILEMFPPSFLEQGIKN